MSKRSTDAELLPGKRSANSGDCNREGMAEQRQVAESDAPCAKEAKGDPGRPSPPSSEQTVGGLTRIRGVPCNPFMSADAGARIEALATCKGFENRVGDVWIVTYPKSGTTWMQGIIKMLLGYSPTVWRYDAVPWPEVADPSEKKMYISLEQLAQHPSPRVFKSHWVARDHLARNGKSKFIYIMRNGLDVAASYYYHTKAYGMYQFDGSWNEFFDIFMAGGCDFGDWFDHVKSWYARKDDEDVLWLTYEGMHVDIDGVIRRVAKFIGVEVNEEVVERVRIHSSFAFMQETEDPSAVRKPGAVCHYRKGIVGDWQAHVTPEQFRRYEARFNKELAPLGLELTAKRS